MRIQVGARTDLGRVRQNNEDSFKLVPELNLFILSDGMGGEAHGEVASHLAVEAIAAHCLESGQKPDVPYLVPPRADLDEKTNRLASAVQLANRMIYESAQKHAAQRGMGATVVAIWINDQRLSVAHVGDSRVYQLRGGHEAQLTTDHTLLQDHLKHGLISAEDAKTAKWGNIISRAVGTHPSVKADTLVVELEPEDEFVICSDGLSGYLEDNELLHQVMGLNARDVVQRLIQLAKMRGGKDNVSVIDVRVTAPPVEPAGKFPSLLADAPSIAPGAPGEPAAAAPAPAQSAAPAMPAAPAVPAAPQITASDKVKALQSIPLFARLDYKELVNVLTIFSVKTFAPGQDVIVEGTMGDELFVILAGTVEVKKAGQVLAKLGRLHYFGEMALVDSDRRSATVTAAEPTKLLVIRRHDFAGLAEREPAIGVKLLWSFVEIISKRLRDTLAHAKSIGNPR